MAQKREMKYEIVRAAAILFVVLMHLCAHITAEPYSIKWWIKTSLLLISSTCNGMFFLISGRFNLTEKNAEDPLSFYKRRVWSVVVPFIIASAVCFALERALMGAEGGYLNALIEVFPSTHYWFVYELAGLLFWTPLFAGMLRDLDLKKKLILTAAVLVCQAVFVFLKDIGRDPGYELPLMGWPLFYIAGSFADHIPDRWKKIITVIGAACLFVSILQMRIFPDSSQGLQDMSPKYFFLVLAMYYGIQRIVLPEPAEKAVSFIAKYSYYVYLFHNTAITQILLGYMII
ncbi:MAG: acyltransferase [Oscillospiraceae bacterium]|nr:acyltransferase [Oscillospiraceae bacterium]